MNLVIDYGNTTAKVGIFDNDQLVEHYTFDNPLALEQFIRSQNVDRAFLSTVKNNKQEVIKWFEHTKIEVLHAQLPLPIDVQYKTPQTLGADRIASICGALKLFPEHDTLVIDAGTCIKYDFIDKNKQYWGGAISPGLSMRFQALHIFTEKLPWVSAPHADIPIMGSSTEMSIQSGVVNGIIAEINGVIEQYRDKFPKIRTILTGGDAGFFENKLKASIFASPELILIGLNSILLHNVHK